MSLVEAALMLGLPWWLGSLLVRGRRPGLGLRRHDDPWAYAGWVHVTGCFAIGLYLLVWVLCGLPLQRGFVVPPLALLCAALQWRLRKDAPGANPATPDAAPRWKRVVFGCVVTAVLVHGAGSMASGNARAVVSGDEILHWTLKGKMIWSAGGLGAPFEQLAAEKTHRPEFWKPLDDWIAVTWKLLPEDVRARLPGPGKKRGYHLDYPLLNPLLHVWAFTCADGIVHWQNRLLIQGFTLALLLILAGALRRGDPLVAAVLLVLCFVLIETRAALRWCYADGMVATGTLLAVTGLLRYRGSGDARFFALTVVGSSVMVWSKNEGLMYLVALAAGAAVVRLRPPPRAAVGLALPLGLVAFTWISNTWYGFHNDLATLPASGGLERLPTVLGWLFENVYCGAFWSTRLEELGGGWLYPAFFLAVLVAPRAAFAPPLRALTVILLLTTVIHVGVYVYTPHPLIWHLGESAQRVVWQTLPCVALWLGRALVADWDA